MIFRPIDFYWFFIMMPGNFIPLYFDVFTPVHLYGSPSYHIKLVINDTNSAMHRTRFSTYLRSYGYYRTTTLNKLISLYRNISHRTRLIPASSIIRYMYRRHRYPVKHIIHYLNLSASCYQNSTRGNQREIASRHSQHRRCRHIFNCSSIRQVERLYLSVERNKPSIIIELFRFFNSPRIFPLKSMNIYHLYRVPGIK